MNENIDLGNSNVNTNNAESVERQNENQRNVSQDAAFEEKLLKQSEVNEIVGAVRKEAAEKARREAFSQSQSSQNYNVNNSTVNNKNTYTENELRQMISEESSRIANATLAQQNEALAQQIAVEFTNKMIAAKDIYPDFEEAVSTLNFPDISDVVGIANTVDNTAEVMYALAKNPKSLGSILALNERTPRLAVSEIKKLSSSIKNNQAALGEKFPNEPLSQMKPSIAGTDSGKMTISDFKKQDWLRG